MQRKSFWFSLAFAVLSGGLVSGAGAQQIKPYFLVIVDTSGSMAWCAGGTQNATGNDDCSCYQNNSCNGQLRTDQNSCGFGQNKIGDAKCALQRIIDSTGGDAVFGLMQFEHPCDGSEPSQACGLTCGGSSNCDDGQLVVEIEEGNASLMREWVDGVAGPGSCNPNGGNHNYPHELTTGQWTPIARSLERANQYLRGNFPGDFIWATDSAARPGSPIPESDPKLSCRPVSVILLTDGDDTCTGNPSADPPARAGALNAGDPRGTTRGGKAFKTYVIGFGKSGGNFNPTVLNNIAAQGGTGNYYPAENERQLSLVLNQIVADAQPPAEICNNADDDCDEKIDEGLPKYCNKPQGIAEPTLCDEPNESNCDGVDDDCDGIIDEGLTNACGLCGAVPREVCDNIDNDCDSRVDEDTNTQNMCGDDDGECEAGKLVCVDGVERCEGEIGPNPEVCDCKDNDCDEIVDEEGDGALCPMGQRCAGCRCVEYCVRTDEFEARCKPGLTAKFENGECLCVVDTCKADECGKSTIERDSAVVCAPDNDKVAACQCKAGSCVPRCDGVECDPDQICSPRNGRCVENNCRGLGCASGSLCDPLSARCVKDECADTKCNAGQVCRAGKCESSCAGVQCRQGEICKSGECETDRCADLECVGELVCDPRNGKCGDNLCAGVACGSGQTCAAESGECAPEPCWDVVCPSKQVCVRGECVQSGGSPDRPPLVPPPAASGTRLLATGGGGCACSVPGQAGASSDLGGLLFSLAGLALLSLRRRSGAGAPPASDHRPRRVRPGLFALMLALLVGCRVSPLCLDCVEADASSSLDGGDGPMNADGGGDAGMDASSDGSDAGEDSGAEPRDAGDPVKCTPSGDETCNGKDDDCDFIVDEDVKPTTNMCSQVGVCAGTEPTCSGGKYSCRYGGTYEKDEASCDGADNDCDGRVDETFQELGNPCEVGTGACRVSGTQRCNAAKTGLLCEVSGKIEPAEEVCNGKDDDCDGMVDEPKSAPGSNGSYVVDDVVQVKDGLWIYKYEASRPDALADKQGIISARTCSRAGVLPWTNVTFGEAVAACETVGMKLCELEDWLSACKGSSGACQWSYTPDDGGSCDEYESDGSDGCNGHDVAAEPGDPDTDALAVSGGKPECYANFDAGKVFDLSGNAKEWTRGPDSPGENPLRGGSYNNSPEGLRCDFDFSVGAAELRLNNVGFRCCTDTQP
jgi:MYXO-CTERM domain-containing protein